MKQAFLFLLSIHLLSAQENLPDLEANPSDFVIDTFQIEVPRYPHAFNPSIVQWKNSLLMSFRVILNEKLPYYSRLGLVWLDENFQAVHEPQLLDTQYQTPSIPSRAEDGRLLTIGDSLYLIYSNCTQEQFYRGAFRIYIGEILYDGKNFHLENPQPLLFFESESFLKREKNWAPFQYEGNLFLAYSLSPHLIFHAIREQNRCETISSTPTCVHWPFGALRGGTPAIEDGDEYLAFFHTSKKMASIHSKGKEAFHYFIGAYRFQKHPPFAITQISPEPIIAKGFYTGFEYKPYWSPVQAIFPCGFIMDDRYIWMAYGRQDHECWIAKLDKQGLMRSLIQINYTENKSLK